MLLRKWTLLILTSLWLSFAGASPAAAQNSACDPVILECQEGYEAIVSDLTSQRNEAIEKAEDNRDAANYEAGQRDAYQSLYHEERALNKTRTPVWVWLGLGAGIVLTIEAIIVGLVVAL